MYMVLLNMHSSPLGHFSEIETEKSTILPKVTQSGGNLGLILELNP